jgi:GTPase SAR1 family protein
LNPEEAMEEYADRKKRALDLLAATISFARERGAPEIVEELEETSRRLAQGRLFVVVCGEFKRGKSTLLNAYLEEKDLLPVDEDIATRLVTTVGYAEREEILVWAGDDRKGKPRSLAREEIAEYVSARRNPDNQRQARLLAIETPNEKLKEGLVLVDTPGVGGIYNEHSGITFAFIPNADVVLFVSDALSPLSADELRFLERRIVPHVSEILFVVTKIDQVLDYRSVVESNREKLAAVLERPAAEISILAVSSLNKLAYLASGDEEDLRDSRFPELEAELWRLLQERGGLLLLVRALRGAAAGLAHLQGPLAAELDALQQQDREEIERRQAQLRQAQERLGELLDRSARWRTELAYGLQDLRKGILGTELELKAVRVRQHAEEYLEDDRLLADPKRIYLQIKVDIQSLYTELFNKLLAGGDDLQREIETASRIVLNPYQRPPVDTAMKLPEIPAIAGKPRDALWKKALEVGRHASVSMTGGTLVGGVIGGILGGVAGVFMGGVGAVPGAQIGALLGGALGQLAGLGGGTRQALEGIRQREREQVRRDCRAALTPLIQESIVLCRSELEKALTDLERWMIEDFVARLSQEKTAAERSLQAFQKGLQTSQAEAGQRIQTLEAGLRRLESLEALCGEQLASALGSRETDPVAAGQGELVGA